MKQKYSYYLILILLLLVVIKYVCSDYKINYKIDNFKVIESYKDNKYLFEIEEDKYFVVSLYERKKLAKKLIQKIEKKEIDEYICYNIVFENNKNELTCFKDNESISFYLIDNENVKKYINSLDLYTFTDELESEGFKFYNNLEYNEYVALWNYNGFYIMHGEEISKIEIFENTKYDNSLCYHIDNFLVLPDYNKNHEFNNFKVVNLKTGKVKQIENKYTIDFDSYIPGSYKNKIYLFDNKYSILYEINYKRNKVEIVGNKELGYFKYKNNKKEESSLKEYQNKILFNKEESIYEIADALYKIYNKKYKVKIFNSNEVKIVKEYQNKVYFIYKDNLYKYDGKITKIFHQFEINFNSKNIIFIYEN